MNTLVHQAWQFQFVQWLWLLVPVFLLVALLFLRYVASVSLQWQLPAGLSSVSQSFRHPRFELITALYGKSHLRQAGLIKWFRMIVAWLMICLLFIALAQPEWVRKELQEPSKFRDIVFVVDTSVSMIQRDYLVKGQRVDRMTLLKGVLTRFIDELKQDNVSIIVYADEAYTLVPLTQDHELAKTMLSRVQIGLAGRTSALGEALAQAVHEAEQSRNKERVLVLLTDATRLTGKIKSDVAMELARQAGLHVYTVAIGARTYEASEKKQSGLIYDPADIDRLKTIARHTGGKFYWAGNTDSLSNAIKDIEKAERSKEAPVVLYIRQSLYQWPLLLAIIMLTMLQLSNLSRRPVA